MTSIKYCRRNDTISGKLHDELVMMDMDKGQYFALNPSATRIWELLEQPRDMETLCKMLCEEFEVKADRCQQEVEKHLMEMVELGLIHAMDDEG